MRPRLVFVHGIGGARRADEEHERWVNALVEGARRAGHSRLAFDLVNGCGPEIVFSYYGDLFGQPQAQGFGVEELDDHAADILIELFAEIVDARLSITSDEQLRDVLAHARAQARPSGTRQGVGDLIRRAVNAATTLVSVGPLRRGGQWITGRLLVRDLAQVARYLARGELDALGRTLDERIRERVRKSLGAGPVIVVAHSLGTVVSLETLHAYKGAVPLLVTLGSPIAMRSVVWPKLVPHPPSTPEPVERWLNFWDRDDIIAVRPQLEAEVAPSTRQVRPESTRVDSDGLWVHTAAKYLAQPAVAGPVAEAIGRLATVEGE
jgi:pimeloyl-ACP methyl ester carboxylesterase